MESPPQAQVDHLLELLAIHRKTLHHYLTQRAMLSRARMPPETAHGIREARREIAAIKATLQMWHVPVTDDVNDLERDEAHWIEIEQRLRSGMLAYTTWFFRIYLMTIFVWVTAAVRHAYHWYGWMLVLAMGGAGGVGWMIGSSSASIFGDTLLIAVRWKGSAWWKKGLAILVYASLAGIPLGLLLLL
ncbi:hypothetical protein [Herpetosiphon gulosus]|uniref:Uncharacterized protein n=1 Tax=Herpetosiphon gulosus TaxID=1973496 RepID=A0ABP9X6J5_9CHLR